ncbi:MAG: hypothetical protein JW764_06590 [Chlorobiaceae bacterium]|nr:hypothetical protein [Chlorobiaceae bacterium]
MSYTSENRFPSSTKKSEIIRLIKLLGYKNHGSYESEKLGRVDEYHWFDDDDYKSWYGVELSIYKDRDEFCVGTRTNITRSYYDLSHQNETIRTLRKFFGGSFITDEGKNRYLHPDSNPPEPAQSGCHLAYQRFGANIISAMIYLESRDFPQHKKEPIGLLWVDNKNPWIISNNLQLPYFVALLEDYFKSTFIALLRYSDNKNSFLKNGRLSPEHLSQISEGNRRIEESITELMPFQNISTICKNFKQLDKSIDFASILREPFRRRKQSLFTSIEIMVDKRHNIIHRGMIDTSLNNNAIKKIIFDLEASVVKCYKHLTKARGWQYDKWWLGNQV